MNLALEHFRVVQLAGYREVDERLVRAGAPHEERETRGELQVGDATRRRSFRGLRRDRLGAEQELGARQNGREPALDARLEVTARFTPHRVERHRRLHVLLRHGSAKGLEGEFGKDAARAGTVFAGDFGLADEDALAALRIADACDIERSGVHRPQDVAARSISGRIAIAAASNPIARCWTNAMPTRCGPAFGLDAEVVEARRQLNGRLRQTLIHFLELVASGASTRAPSIVMITSAGIHPW